MAFNPLQSYLQGQQAGQGQQIQRLSGALTGQMQQGQDPSSSLDFQQLMALDPDRASKMMGTFQSLSEGRKKSYFEDMVMAKEMLINKDYEGFESLMGDRRSALNDLPDSDSSGTAMVMNRYKSGDIAGVIEGLGRVEQAGVKLGYVKASPTTKNKLGTYTPSDYTVDSWAEFAKYGNPAALVRYESDSKTRALEIKEAAQKVREEKFALEKEKSDMDKSRREMLAAQKENDLSRAKFLEIEEGNNAVANINSLLDNDLDLIYGSNEWVLPDKLRGQRGKNMLARRDQISSTMSLMAAGKLKGQGTITENERKMLSDSVSFLKNQDISAEQARAELERVKPIFEYFITGARPNMLQVPASNNRGGGQIMTDANGNKAMVYPDGTFEEL